MEMLMGVSGGCRAKPKREGEPTAIEDCKIGGLQGAGHLTFALSWLAQLYLVSRCLGWKCCATDAAMRQANETIDRIAIAIRIREPGGENSPSSGGNSFCQDLSVLVQQSPSRWNFWWLRKGYPSMPWRVNTSVHAVSTPRLLRALCATCAKSVTRSRGQGPQTAFAGCRLGIFWAFPTPFTLGRSDRITQHR